MKGKFITENGQEIEIMLTDEQLEQVKVKLVNGYERVAAYHDYYYVAGDGNAWTATDRIDYTDDKRFEIGNYFSDRKLAENAARAYRLEMRLKKFARDNSKKKIDWENARQSKWCIYKNHASPDLTVSFWKSYHDFGQIYFDSRETANKAIEQFKDELIWYFTEYKDSL